MMRESDSERRLGGAISKIVSDQVADVNPDAFEDRPPYPGAPAILGTRRHPQALPALRAARRVAVQARAVERDALEHARGKGHTWTEIGRALGKEFADDAKRADMPLNVAAWRYAACRVLPTEEAPWSMLEPKVWWRCWECAQTISETHPDDGSYAQRGHGPGCPRMSLTPNPSRIAGRRR